MRRADLGQLRGVDIAGDTPMNAVEREPGTVGRSGQVVGSVADSSDAAARSSRRSALWLAVAYVSWRLGADLSAVFVLPAGVALVLAVESAAVSDRRRWAAACRLAVHWAGWLLVFGWMAYPVPVMATGWLLAAAASAAVFWAALGVGDFLRRRSGRRALLAVPLLVVLAECVRRRVLAIAVDGLEQPLADWVPMTRAAAFAGELGVLLLVMLLAASGVLIAFAAVTRVRSDALCGVAVFLATAVVMVFACFALPRAERSGRQFVVGVARTTATSSVIGGPGQEAMFRQVVDALRRDLDRFDLVVLPETCLPPMLLIDGKAVRDASTREQGDLLRRAGRPARQLAGRLHELACGPVVGGGIVTQITGVSGRSVLFRTPLPQNCVLSVGSGGTVQVLSRKERLAPGIEEDPLRHILGRDVVSNTAFSRGHPSDSTSLQLETVPGQFAVAICYEAYFPGLIRRRVRGGESGLFVLADNADPTQTHAARSLRRAAQFRAVENGVPVAMSVNAGESGVWNRFGMPTVSLGGTDHVVRRYEFPVDCGPTVYRRIGEWPLLIGCGLGLLQFVVPARSNPAALGGDAVHSE